MKNKSKKRKRSLTLKIFRVKPLWQFALVLFAWLALACPGNDGGDNGNGGGNGASPYVCPNGTEVMATQDNMPTEANVTNCAGCDPGFHLTDGENATQLCRRLILTNVDNVEDDGDTDTLKLDGAISVTTALVGSTTYLFVAGRNDDGVSVFSVASDGALTNVANVDDSGDVVPDSVGGELELDSPRSVTTAVVGGTTYLFVAGFVDDGVSAFSVGDNGILTNVANVDDSDDSELELDGAESVTTAVVGDTTYLFVAGQDDDGVSVFSVGSDDGALTNVDNVEDDGDTDTLQLNGPRSVTTAVVGDTTYLFVAGSIDDGVSVFSGGSGGALTNVDNVDDDETLNLAQARSVTTAVVGDTTYLFVAGIDDAGVSVFSIGSNGALTNVANVEDDGDDGTLNLAGAVSVTTAVIGRSTYLFVAGSLDLGVSVFRFGSDGTLTNVANVDDRDSDVPKAPGLTSTLQLGNATSVTTAVIGGTTYLFVAGFFDDGVSVFRLDLVSE